MISEFCLLLWIDIISVLLVFVGYGAIIHMIRCKDKTTLPYLMCAAMSFILGVVALINISLIFNL